MKLRVRRSKFQVSQDTGCARPVARMKLRVRRSKFQISAV